MAITTELETILNARYGREVRQAIHDGIKQAYEDAIANGNANMEVSQARGSYPSLAERLIAEFDGKISKGKVEVTDLTQSVKDYFNALLNTISIGQLDNLKGKLDQTFLTSELIAQIAGTAAINAIPALGSVRPDMTTFFKNSTNLHNPAEEISGYYLHENTGALVAFQNSKVSGRINVAGLKEVTIRMARRVVFFDGKDKFISTDANKTSTEKTVQVPAEAHVMRYDWLTTDLPTGVFPQVNIGSTLLPYENFRQLIPENYLDLQNLVISADKTDFLKKGKNLFDKTKIAKNQYIDIASGGKIVSSPSYHNSDYMSVIGGSTYVANKPIRFVAYYTSKNAFLSGEANPEIINVPANCSLMRVTLYKGHENTLQIELGTEVTEYQPYGYVLDSSKVLLEKSKDPAIAEPVSIAPKIWAVVNEPVEIYDNNIVADCKSLTFDYDGVGKQMTDKWTHTPTTVGTEDLSIEIYRDFAKAGSTIVRIVTTDIKTENRKALVIGDSTVNEGYMTQHVLDRYAQESSVLTLVGTRGKDGNFHEGRGGWTAQRYRTNAVYENVANPFYNPTTQDFDFSYYMAQNGYSGLTDVIFQLGINDTFSLKLDNYVDGIKQILTHYEKLIQSVRNYDPSIKIGIAVTIPPTNSQDVFGESYGVGTPLWRYKKINAYWISELVKHFGNREGENIRLIAQNNVIEAGVDHRDGVHLTPEGYAKLGNAVYAYLKNN